MNLSVRVKILSVLFLLNLISQVPLAFSQFSQSGIDSIKIVDFESLEKQIKQKKLLLQTQHDLEDAKREAFRGHDDITVARSLYDLMRIRDQVTEDTLYFRNSAFIDTLLAADHSPKLKAILYLMRAQRVSRFDSRPTRFNYAAYRSTALKPDYAALTRTQRDSLVSKDLDNAFRVYQSAKSEGKQLLWLSGSPDVFLFGATFQDIILAERVNLLANKVRFSSLSKPPTANWAGLSNQGFQNKLDSLSSRDSTHTDILAAYNRWMKFHKNEPEVSFFIQSLSRKYIYLSSYNPDSLTRQAYVRYLQQCTASVYPLVKAHAVYQLCLTWNEEGNKYNSPNNAYSYPIRRNFNPQYQFYPAKALQLYEANTDLLYRYPIFNKVLGVMKQQILSAGIEIEIQDHLPKGAAIPFRVSYKNTDSLYYRVIRINANGPMGNKSVHATEELLAHQPVAAGVFALPLPADHNQHAVFLKLKELPAGRYRLLFNNTPLKEGGYDINSIEFNVTGIAAVNTDRKVFILDRKTGKPLAGAQVRAFKRKVPVNTGVAIFTAGNGEVNIPDILADSINIVYKGDTTWHRLYINESKLRGQVYNKNEFDDMADYYKEKLSVEIFTDRSIYRPGQTVHYKIIMLTRNSNTGEATIFNAQNVGEENYKNQLKKWLDDNDDKLMLRNPFDKTVDSAQIKLNDFGSFAGDFIIPKTAATGYWRIDNGIKESYYNRGSFSVEEYKRPTLELSMEKQKKVLIPGQPFTIKLKLRSLSGAQLGNIPISYTINRSSQLPANKQGDNIYTNVKLIQKTGNTDEKGEMLIAVNDTALSSVNLADSVTWRLYYGISAVAVDATGESIKINESVNVSSRPIGITIPVEATYDRQTFPALNVNTTADFEGVVGRKVNLKLYKVNEQDYIPGNNNNEVDQWYYPEPEWNTWFPDMAKPKTVKPEHTLVLDTMVNTAGYEKLVINKQMLKVGFYEMEGTVKDNGRIVGQVNYHFKIFDSKAGEVPGDDLNYMPLSNPQPGDMVKWYGWGKNDSYTIYQVLYVGGKEKRVVKNIYLPVKERAGVRQWVYRIPKDVHGQITFNRISVNNNKATSYQKIIYIGQAGSSPDVVIERYRKVMVPGEQETFTLSVKTKKINVAAEIMTTLYDAALDKLKPHQWNLPNTAANFYMYTNWSNLLGFVEKAGNFPVNGRGVVMREIHVDEEDPNQIFTSLEGRAAGISVTGAQGLNEVVVVAYGVQAKRDVTGSVSNVMIRGISSLQDYKQPLIILNGEVYSGDLKSLSPDKISQIMVLKGADASALYGARGADGVLVISTNGPIVLPHTEDPIVKVRKNFNETAFFYPQIHAGADGYYTFTFTMPETATEWNWKILAHTRDARFTYLERKLQTQLNLMVQPNMPRLLYQGDKLYLQSRVSNLDTVAIKGKATCKIEDAVTGEDITAQLTGNNTQSFDVNKKSSGAVGVLLHVPAQQLNPLKIVVSVISGSTADAEEHIIPVLSSRIFIKQSQRVQFADKPIVTLTSVKLPADASLFGIGISINQKPQATLVYALPWLANYSYNCAEQTFNKLRADVTALRLMQKDTLVQKAFKNAAIHNGKHKPQSEIPDDIAEETMPWLGITNRAAIQQKQLFSLLDTPATKITINKHLDRLYKLQSTDGGLMWFEGGNSSQYISSYILAGFGQLKQQGWNAEYRYKISQQEFIKRLFKFNQNSLKLGDSYTKLYTLYAMSYWMKELDMSAADLSEINLLLSSQWKKADDMGLDQRAMLIISTLRSNNVGGSALYQKALQQLKSIRQLAIQDEQYGLRWKAISDSEELNNSAEETMALIAEAFEVAGNYKDVDAGVVKWLLTAKQDQRWQTTKATAAAINMLQKQKGSTFGETKTFSAQISGHSLSVSDGLLDGIPAAFTEVKQVPQSITLKQQDANTAGNLTWYYFAEPAHLDTLNKAVKISRLFYTYNEQKGWMLFTPGTIFKAGDRVKVKLSIETSSRLKFVHISDPRAAGFEPADNNSGYQYNKGFSYYQSVRDTGLDLFTESIPKGISEVSYELIVAHSGEFASGPVVLQCMYRPAVIAYSKAERFEIK